MEYSTEQSVGRGAADRVVPEVQVDWRRPGQRNRYVYVSALGRAQWWCLRTRLAWAIANGYKIRQQRRVVRCDSVLYSRCRNVQQQRVTVPIVRQVSSYLVLYCPWHCLELWHVIRILQ